jgi:gas vesicle protein
MVNENLDPQYHNGNGFGILAGLLIGCVAGAVTMLLLAPQSGKDTRNLIQQKGIELRDRTTGMMDDTLAQVRLNADKIAAGGRQKAEDMKHQGQELLAGQLDRVSAAAQAGKKAVQAS